MCINPELLKINKYKTAVNDKLQRVAIFGAGESGISLKKCCEANSIKVLRFFDNDSNKWGNKLGEIPVFPPEKIKNIVGKAQYLIIASFHEKEILKQLSEFKLKNINIITRQQFEMTIKMDKIRNKYGFIGLQVGCGPNRAPGFLNCDIKEGDLLIDATKKFPFNDDTFDYIYSEHFIEHITFDEALFFMKESHRILKKGGVFRCLTPDFSILLSIADSNPLLIKKLRERLSKGLISKNGDCIEKPRYSEEHSALWDSRDDIINAFMREWGHKYLWSGQHLCSALEYVGFVNANVMPFGTSENRKACIDSKNRWGWEWTVAVEAKKLKLLFVPRNIL